MTILHFITSLTTGGAEMMLFKLLKSMDRKRIEPVVVSLSNPGRVGRRMEALGVPVFSLGMQTKFHVPLAMMRLRNIVRSVKSDIYQGWMYHGNVAAYLAGVMTNFSVPVVWNIRHSIYDLKKEKPLTRHVILAGAKKSHRTARIIYNSMLSSGQHEALGYDGKKALTIPNGFDLMQFKPDLNARRAIRRALGISEDILLIGLIARYHSMKDHANFLRAASLLVRKRSNVKFILAGRHVDNNNQKLNKFLAELDIRDHVYLLGERQDIEQLMAALDIVSTASGWGEGFPNVIGEAMASGIPCVVTDIGDSAFLVGSTGKVVAPERPEDLTQAWQEFIDMGDHERRRLGEQARNRIIQNFSLTKIAQRYEQLYTDVLK